MHFGQRGQRHPLGIFNLTFATVVHSFRLTLDELATAESEARYARPQNYNWSDPLLNATDQLLDAIVQHLDSYSQIIATLFSDPHCAEAKRATSRVRRETKPYRDRVAKIVNAIKHNHRKLSVVHFHGPGLFFPGYFVEGVCAGGAIGPDPAIHPNSNTAISFNRDLPFHMVSLYFAASVLADAVHDIDDAPMQITETSLTRPDKDLADVIRRLSALPRTYFPDEARMSVPLVEYRQTPDSDEFKVVLEYPAHRAKARGVPAGCRIQVSWRGDGVSKTYKLPYWQQRPR